MIFELLFLLPFLGSTIHRDRMSSKETDGGWRMRHRNRDTRGLSDTAKGDSERPSEWREGRRIREEVKR